MKPQPGQIWKAIGKSAVGISEDLSTDIFGIFQTLSGRFAGKKILQTPIDQGYHAMLQDVDSDGGAWIFYKGTRQYLEPMGLKCHWQCVSFVMDDPDWVDPPDWVWEGFSEPQ